MSSGIITSPQVQMIPMVDLPQQPQEQYYALAIPQDQYLPNNQALTARKRTPAEIYIHDPAEIKRARRKMVASPLAVGALTGALTYSTLHFTNFMAEGLFKSKHKIPNNFITGATAFLGGLFTAVQWGRGFKEEYEVRHR